MEGQASLTNTSGRFAGEGRGLDAPTPDVKSDKKLVNNTNFIHLIFFDPPLHANSGFSSDP